MNKYIFELGQNHLLSIAELNEVLQNTPTFSTEKIAIYSVEKEIDEKNIQNKLGGTIKIMKVIGEIPYPNEKPEELTIYLNKNIETYFSNEHFDKNKIDFGISIFNVKNHKYINIKSLLKNFKKFLKNSLNTSSRFVNIGYENPKTATVYKAKLAEKGLDINIVGEKENILIAKGISIQNIDSYRLRDYEKPARDARIGMLPPKLAQIMLNLAGNNANEIYDPFCGTGTIIYEGMLMKKTMIGSDINAEMIKASKINCDFIQKKFNTISAKNIFLHDARKSFPKEIKNIDGVVSEGYLGPAISQKPSTEKANEYYLEIEKLYSIWLNNTKEIIKKDAKLVFCMPQYNTKIVHPLEKILKKTNLKLVGKYLYKRLDQQVGRLICILENKSN